MLIVQDSGHLDYFSNISPEIKSDLRNGPSLSTRCRLRKKKQKKKNEMVRHCLLDVDYENKKKKKKKIHTKKQQHKNNNNNNNDNSLSYI